MKKKKFIKTLALMAFAGLVIGGGTVFYLFNMPHRDIESAKTDYSLTVTKLVSEYLENNQAANNKYLSNNGESKILEVSGRVFKISEDYSGHSVVLLKNNGNKAGVSCTFTLENKYQTSNLEIGQQVKIKGVIHSGATYDEDLELYEHVVLDKSSLIQN